MASAIDELDGSFDVFLGLFVRCVQSAYSPTKPDAYTKFVNAASKNCRSFPFNLGYND